MAWENIQEKYIPKDYDFYRNHYHQVIYVVMGVLVIMMIAVGVVLYQMLHRPKPIFTAIDSTGQTMQLEPYDQPNLRPDTILRWASKAATIAYTLNFNNYKEQLNAVRPYFTADGWQDFMSSSSSLINRIVQNQLFVSGVVSGPPVIANQGPLPGKGYVWRIQIPFLVTYQSANTEVQQRYYVVLTIVHVPTATNPQGIGIDQFVMV
jgi:intracellular multiplication protein IcmL